MGIKVPGKREFHPKMECKTIRTKISYSNSYTSFERISTYIRLVFDKSTKVKRTVTTRVVGNFFFQLSNVYSCIFSIIS